jgi:D-glycero-alpha-D-manno-heptose 1-phosphate guanylyltransferase
MIIKDAIILAGGLGTRLRSAVPDLPKCMAPVAGKPFLHYVITYLQKQGIQHFIFSLGYKHEVIETYLKEYFPALSYHTSIEASPLGTGGAIKLAVEKSTCKNVLILNGDTIFEINVQQLAAFHNEQNADCTLSLKPMKDFERYGVVETDSKGNVESFKEKKYYSAGLINGGVYALNINRFLSLPLPEIFSFEKDYLEKYFSSQNIKGMMQDEYFIDIGIPEDFEKAQKELKEW